MIVGAAVIVVGSVVTAPIVPKERAAGAYPNEVEAGSEPYMAKSGVVLHTGW